MSPSGQSSRRFNGLTTRKPKTRVPTITFYGVDNYERSPKTLNRSKIYITNTELPSSFFLCRECHGIFINTYRPKHIHLLYTRTLDRWPISQFMLWQLNSTRGVREKYAFTILAGVIGNVIWQEIWRIELVYLENSSQV